MPDEEPDEVEVLRALLREIRVHDAHGYGRWTSGMKRRVARALGEKEPARGPF